LHIFSLSFFMNVVEAKRGVHDYRLILPFPCLSFLPFPFPFPFPFPSSPITGTAVSSPSRSEWSLATKRNLMHSRVKSRLSMSTFMRVMSLQNKTPVVCLDRRISATDRIRSAKDKPKFGQFRHILVNIHCTM